MDGFMILKLCSKEDINIFKVHTSLKVSMNCVSGICN